MSSKTKAAALHSRVRTSSMFSGASAAILALAQALSTQATAADARRIAGPSDDTTDRRGDAEELELELEEIIVVATPSRIRRPDFVASTPTIVLTEEDLQAAARTNLGAIIADLPSARNSVSDTVSTSNTVAGGRSSGADLRGMGVARTLVLIDGRRPVPINGTGSVNVDAIPLGMVERVEVVTGGASASYGSDAVSGVINIIMADRRDGFRASAQYQGTTHDPEGEYGYSLNTSYGFSFAGDRAHVIVGGNYRDQSTIGPRSRNPILTWDVLRNPAWTSTNGEPQGLLRPDISFSQMSLGGLIAGCTPPNNPGCAGLRGLTFESDGTSRPFVLGQFANEATMSGGDVQATHETDYAPIRSPVTVGNGYGRFTFDLADNLLFKTDVSYSNTFSDSPLLAITINPEQGGGIVIRQDNAFLPANIRNAMQAAGLQAIRMGRVAPDWGLIRSISSNNTSQGAVGLEGKFGNSWSWDAFYSYGESRTRSETTNQRIQSRFAAAVDSIVVNGQAVCRNLAANPGCVPLNVFGAGNASQAALDYVLGVRGQFLDVTQHEASAILRGDPFSVWAGPVSIATGGEWRRQRLEQRFNDTVTQGLLGPIPPSRPSEDEVKEGFFETVIPLAKDLPLMEALMFNGAVRRSDYERAGYVTSWKIGVTNDVTDALRLRFTRSQDIRAPSLSELNQFANPIPGLVIDQRTNTPVPITNVTNGTGGNLTSEEALTTTFGVVYRPSWAPRLDLSLDFYKIDVGGFITNLSAQEIVNRCIAGNAALCALINSGSFNPAADPITQVNSGLVNVARLVGKGADFQADHRMSFLRGQLMSRLLISYAEELSLSDGNTVADGAGVLGSEGSRTMPRVRAIWDERYRWRDLSFNVRARFIEGGDRRRDITLDSNHIGSVTYLDLGVGYQTSLFGKLTIQANLTNALDRAPPATPSSVFDSVGRTFTVGFGADF